MPSIHLAYREPSLRVALETASVLIALLMALLVHGRARRTRSSNELVLALGLVWLAAANLFTAALVVAELHVSAAADALLRDRGRRRVPDRRGRDRPGLGAARRGATSRGACRSRPSGSRSRSPPCCCRSSTTGSGAPPNPATIHVSHSSAMMFVQLVATTGFALGAAGFARQRGA